MSNGLFRYGNLYGGPPYLVSTVDPDIVVSLAYRVVARSRSTRKTYHYPIMDFHVEPIYNIGYAIEKIYYHLTNGDKVYVHCLGGCGRTGTVVSAYLILFHGYSVEDAVMEFYRQRGCTIESFEQEIFLKRIHEILVKTRSPMEIIDLLKRIEKLDRFLNASDTNT